MTIKETRYAKYKEGSGYRSGTGGYYNRYRPTYNRDITKAKLVKSRNGGLDTGEVFVAVEVTFTIVDKDTLLNSNPVLKGGFRFAIVNKGEIRAPKVDYFIEAKDLINEIKKKNVGSKSFSELYDIIPVEVNTRQVLDIKVI